MHESEILWPRIPNSNSSPPRKSNIARYGSRHPHGNEAFAGGGAAGFPAGGGLQVPLSRGDFIDGWELKFRWFWREEYNTLIKSCCRKSRKQTKVIYITGNHDEFSGAVHRHEIGSVTIAREVIHTAADGKNTWSSTDTGGRFDTLQPSAGKLGSHLYNWILDFNLYFNRLRRAMGFVTGRWQRF